METACGTPELSPTAFAAISELTRRLAGISMSETKHDLVRSRLARRLRALGLDDFDAYVACVRRDACERDAMIDALTTNKTSFFREARHFEVLEERVLKHAPARLRGWSAACSTGEEAYTLAMLVRDHLGDGADARLLATDISPRVLAKARDGVYPAHAIEAVPESLRKQSFKAVEGKQASWCVAPAVRAFVAFARLNLLDEWPVRGPFDFVFLRNVMIYFEKPLQEELVQRFYQLLAPGGLLFLGLAESLNGVRNAYRFVEPGVYAK